MNAHLLVHGKLSIEIIPWGLLEARWDEQLLFGTMFLGVFLLGAVPTYLYQRWKLISPAGVVLVPFGILLWVESRSPPGQADLVSAYGLYMILWPLVLLVVGAVALGERWLRGRATGRSELG
jgi:hypothetical protein